MLVKHDGQELVNGQHLRQRLCLDELPCPAFTDQIAECPVRVERLSDMVTDELFVAIHEDLTANVPINKEVETT